MLAPGISFIVRTRNEESYLAACLASLRDVTVPHEIIVVLHLCTDGSRSIAEAAAAAGQPVRVHAHDKPVSRAGYEMLVTPVSHEASMAAYNTAAFDKRAYKWAFRWDADFVATSELLYFLNNTLQLDADAPMAYAIPCHLSDTVINCERYLTNVRQPFGKYMFWEVALYPPDTKVERLPCGIHSLPPTVLKEYWSAAPWFLGVDSELTERYNALVNLCGPEPVGLARASNPECTPYIRLMEAKEQELAAIGISFYY
jgi:hypothetical protein